MNPGSINISTLYMYTSNNVIDLVNVLQEASLYESIFTPGVILDLTLLDTQDIIGTFRLSGNETLEFVADVAGSSSIRMNLSCFKLNEVENIGSQKGKIYLLRCVSEEVLYAQTNYVQKGYNSLCSEIVYDIHVNYLKSIKPLIIENTSGSQNIVIPSRKPFEAINLVKKRSISVENSSSSYLYFENHGQYNNVFNFVTLESLFGNSPVKSFNESDAINADPFHNRTDNIILSKKFAQQFDSIDKIKWGGNRRISTINLTTQDYKSNVINTSNNVYKDGGSGKLDVAIDFLSKYNSNNPKQSYIPVDWSQRAATHIPENTPDFEAYIAILLQNVMKILVPGDTLLTAGQVINCNFINKNNSTSKIQLDKLMSGNFLITRIRHKIGTIQDSPRYTCVIEGIKGSYND